jgi:MFS family permease
MRVRLLQETYVPEQTRPKTTVTTIIRGTLSEFKDTVKNLTRNLWLLFLLGGLFQFGVSVGAIFMVTYATQDVIHLSSANWGLITTAQMIMSLFSLPFGVLADRYGRRRLVIASLALAPLMVLGFLYSRTFMYVFVFAVGLAFLSNIASLASQALFIDYTPREHRGRINALTSIIGASQNLNFQRAAQSTFIGAVGNLVGGWLYVNVSYATPFYVMMGMVILTLLIITLWIKEPETREE